MNERHTFPTASTIKIPIMLEVFRQVDEESLALEEVVPVATNDVVPGTGVLRWLDRGICLTVNDMVQLMIILSDNTATNALIRRIGLQNVNDFMDDLALYDIRLHSAVTFKKVGDDFISIGSATPAGLATLLEKLACRSVLTPGACDAMVSILKRQQHRDYIPRRLPVSALERDLSAGDKRWWCGNKPGFMPGIRADVAIVGRDDCEFVMAIMTEGCRDPSPDPDNEAATVIAEISRALFLEFCDA